MSNEPTAVVRAYFAAWLAHDRLAAQRMAAADFRFTSPLDNGLDRASYFARCWPNSETMAALTLEHLVADGEVVFVTYEQTSTDGRRFRNSERLTVRDGQVRAVEVYFGWNLPHTAPPGGFIDPPQDGA